jgi:hypothetical protein
MNDIFKLFKKRAQSGKGTNIQDVIKDLNENEQDELSDVGKFDRANKSYLSISKSGRLKSKKSQNQSRVLNDDLFSPSNNLNINYQSNIVNDNRINRPNNKPFYDQNSDSSQTSSTNSSFRSSFEDVNGQQKINYNIINSRFTTGLDNQYNYKSSASNNNNLSNSYNFVKGYQKKF